jgi:elongation factor 1-gamma
MKLYIVNSTSHCCAAVRVVAELTGTSLETITVDNDMKNTLKAKNPMGKYPLLETDEGCLTESSAICVYLAQLAKKNLGNSPVQRALVDQWISYANTTVAPCVEKVNTGIFGLGKIMQNDWNDASKNLKAFVKVINTGLEGKKWLAGDEPSVADVILAIRLLTAFQTVLDGGFRKAMKNVEAWAQACYALPAFVKVFGRVQMCAKALKPIVEVEKKEPKKAAQPKAAEAPKPKKEEKPKDNVESLPPTSFNLFDFKTFFVNHKDKKGEAVDEFYKQLDWEGWSFWHLKYDIYEGEGDKLHITSNLLTGFLSRAEHTSKYTFGRIGVFGEEGGLQIQGVWLMRGQEIPDGLRKEHPQFEYYFTKKLDPRGNPEHDKLVRDYFGCKEEDVVEGLKCQVIRWQK